MRGWKRASRGTAHEAYLFHPLLSEVIGLALDAESGNGEHQIALVESSGPLQDRVDDALVGASNVTEDGSDVGSVNVDRVDVGEAAGQFVNQWQMIEQPGEVIERSVGRHGQGLCSVHVAMAGLLEPGDSRRGNGEAQTKWSNRCSTKRRREAIGRCRESFHKPGSKRSRRGCL